MSCIMHKLAVRTVLLEGCTLNTCKGQQVVIRQMACGMRHVHRACMGERLDRKASHSQPNTIYKLHTVGCCTQVR